MIAQTSGRVTVPGKDGVNGKGEGFEQEEALYNLENDLAESTNLIEDNLEIASLLRRELEAFERSFKNEARQVGITKIKKTVPLRQ